MARTEAASQGVEKVSRGESGGNTLKDGWISRHNKQLKINTVNLEKTLPTYVSLCKKLGGRDTFWQGF